MKKEAQKASVRKPYEKPQIKWVKLETVEATLGVGCWTATQTGETQSLCNLTGCSEIQP